MDISKIKTGEGLQARLNRASIPARMCPRAFSWRITLAMLIAMCPWQESNPHQRLRRALLYPLSYKGIIIQRNIATLKRRVNNLRSCVLDFLKQSVFIFIMSDYVFKLGAIYGLNK